MVSKGGVIQGSRWRTETDSVHKPIKLGSHHMKKEAALPTASFI